MKIDSLQNIYKGFQKLSQPDQAEYIKYLRLVIKKTENLDEKNKLVGFKNKLEKTVKNVA